MNDDVATFAFRNDDGKRLFDAANDFLRRGKGVSSRLIKTLKKLDPPWGLLRGENLLRTIDLVWAGDQITLRWPERETTVVPLACGDASFG